MTISTTEQRIEQIFERGAPGGLWAALAKDAFDAINNQVAFAP